MMRKMLLWLLLLGSLQATAQVSLGHQKKSVTAKQDSMIASFAAQRERALVKYGYIGEPKQKNDSALGHSKSIMLRQQLNSLPQAGQSVPRSFKYKGLPSTPKTMEDQWLKRQNQRNSYMNGYGDVLVDAGISVLDAIFK